MSKSNEQSRSLNVITVGHTIADDNKQALIEDT